MTELAAINKTRFARRFTRSGETPRRECWGAKTTDGLWTLDRLEVSGTPWEATYEPTGESFWFTSLRSARLAIANGSAMTLIEAQRREASRAAR